MKKAFIILLLITVFGGFLRFYKLSDNPISLNTDEVSFAYAAYSILKTGRDEHGEPLPVTFRSIGDYKNPVSIYLLVPSIAVFGMNEFGARFPFALMGTLAIPLFYLIGKKITNNISVGLLTALFLAISPWHVFYSRFGNDPPIAMVIVSFGLLFFLSLLEKLKTRYAILSSFFFVLSMYAYYSERIFIPIVMVMLAIIFLPTFIRKIKLLVIFFAVAFLVVSPLLYRTVFGPDLARGGMVFLGRDIDYRRYVILDQTNSNGLINILSLFFLAAKRFLNYFQPDFLFFNGLNMTHEGSLGLGVMYLFDIPILLLGLWELLKGQNKYKFLIFGWILLSLVPASFTNNEQSTSRTIVILPMLLTVSAIGFYRLLLLFKDLKEKLLKRCLISSSVIVVTIVLLHALLVYVVHFPIDRSEFSFYGNKEAIQFILENKKNYKEIVFDPFRGVEAPNIYGLPEYYYLFYGSYDPAKFQKEVQDNIPGFDKLNIRKIYWPKDRSMEEVLFVGSPWSLPMQDIKEDEILKKIYLKNGRLALLIVTPKPHI